MRTEPAPGSDPTPSSGERATEDDPAAWGDATSSPDTANDARLRADKPPHWG
ncbi:hypothetical protein [Amnibacterium kyonggiense]